MSQSFKKADEILRAKQYQQSNHEQVGRRGIDMRDIAKECIDGKRPMPRMQASAVEAAQSQLQRLRQLASRMGSEQQIIHQDIVDKMTK